MTTKTRYKKVLDYFQQTQPIAETELEYQTPFQLLVAVILSAQCTDKRVNIITRDLFRRFPDAETFAESEFDEVFEYIKSCSYPNNKAKHIIASSKMIISEFAGEIPADMDSLLKLPGVGRKTANVILSVVFKKAAMAVDTHVFRVSERIGLTENSKTPLETEKQLIKNIPENLQPIAHHWLILHGRYICTARSPKCEKCGITEFCKTFKINSGN